MFHYERKDVMFVFLVLFVLPNLIIHDCTNIPENGIISLFFMAE